MDWKRDLVREDLFNSSYQIKPEVWIRYEINSDYTFKVIELKFKYRDREWDLVEVYDGNTNLSKHVTLTGIEKPFINPRGACNDAEHKLIELMREI
jgi:hypothetical protein